MKRILLFLFLLTCGVGYTMLPACKEEPPERQPGDADPIGTGNEAR